MTTLDRVRVLVSAAVVALLLGPLGVSPAAAGGDMLNMAEIAADAGQLDPHVSVKSQDTILFGQMFNGLVRFRPGSMDPASIEPDLAERWESSSDGLTWTFYLRKGAQFHHGYGEVTAEDIAFSLERAGDARISAFSSDYAEVASIEPVSRYAVRIRLKRAVPSLLALVADHHGGYVVSKKAVQEAGDNFKARPIGTGPFAFGEYRAKQWVKLVAHKDYFRGTPKLKGLTFRYIPSDSSRELAFDKGELDLFVGKRDEKWIARMSERKDAIVDITGPGELRTLHLNVTQKPLNDIRVRKAIAHAMNREEMMLASGRGITQPTYSPVPNGYLGSTSDVTRYDYGPDKAKALLKEAGYPDGLTIKMIGSNRPTMMKDQQLGQEQLRRVGIKVDLDTVDHTTFHAQIRKDLSPMVLYGAARFPVADAYLTQFYHSRSIVNTPTAVTNFSHCDAADAEIDAARVEPNPKKQLDLWKTAQRKIVDKICSVALFEVVSVWVRRKNLDYGYDLKASLSYGPLITEQTELK